MSKILLLIAMIWFHILDDFCLQSHTLCNLKQRRYWDENAPDPMYRYDYIVALAAHAFSWTTMVFIPAIAYAYIYEIDFPTLGFCVAFFGNVLVHGMVDDEKANRHDFNLVVDQGIHLAQIVFTWVLVVT